MRSGDAVIRTVGCPGSARVMKPPARSAAASRPTRPRSATPNRSSVSSTRPPQHWPSSGPSALSSRRYGAPAPAIIDWASASASHSSAPPPMVPENRPSGRTIMRAPGSRGLDPWTFASVTSTAAPCSVRKRSTVGQTWIITDSMLLQRPYRMQDRFRSRRGVEPYRLPRRQAVDGVGDRGEHRDREHQRRLADRLRPVDRRFAIGAVEQRDTEIGWHIGCAGDLVGRRRMGEQPALVVEPQLLGSEPTHALDEPALDLADVDRRIERAADVVKDVDALDFVFAGQRGDGDFGAGRAIGEV